MSVFDEPYVKMTRAANNEDWNKDLEGEIWKDIPGYEGMYQFSNKNRVKSLPRTVTKANGGTRFVPEMVLTEDRIYILNKDGVREQFSVNKLKEMVPFRRTKKLFNLD